MLFPALLLFFITLIIGGIQFFVVSSGLKSGWRLNAPSVIVEKIKSRNRAVLIVVFVLVSLSVVVEAVYEDYSYWIVNQQTYLLPVPVPEWALIYTSVGSLSWLLYLVILLGALLGCVFGSWFAAKQYSLLRAVKPFSLV